MLTFFTIPKPFVGDDALRQRNALWSWSQSAPGCEILVFGDDASVAEAGRELGATHCPGIAVNDFGTPRLDWAFREAQERARHDILCYANADMIFLPGLLEAVAGIDFRGTLMVGRRWNLDVSVDLVSHQGIYPGELKATVAEQGELYSPNAIDYFVFTRGLVMDMPPFVVGRPRWDNWMIGHALKKGCRVVDATDAVTAIHQDHGYSHVPERDGRKWLGPEARENEQLLEDTDRGSIQDATHAIQSGTLRRLTGDVTLERRLQKLQAMERAGELRPTALNRLRLSVAERLFWRRARLPKLLGRDLVYFLTSPKARGSGT